MVLEGDGLRLELPVGWGGRFLRRSPHLIALQAASFPLHPDDQELGERSVARMPDGGSFLALIEYLPGSGVEPGKVPFHPSRLDLPLDPTGFTPITARPGLSLLQQSFTESGRPFLLQLVIAGSRLERRRQLPLLDRVLGSLAVSPREAGRLGQTP